MYFKRIKTALDLEIEAVNEFYSHVGYPHKASRGESLVLALIATEIVGAVRLAREEGTQVLRGMQVDPRVQGQGVGTELLRLLNPLFGGKCFCIPYGHLQNFYGGVGFRPARADETPQFLVGRLAEYRRQDPEKKYLVMVR